MGEEKIRHVRVPTADRLMQRRHARLHAKLKITLPKNAIGPGNKDDPAVDFGPPIKGECRRSPVAVVGRTVQRREPIFVFNIHIDAMGNQQANHPHKGKHPGPACNNAL